MTLGLIIPEWIPTYNDGRKNIQDIYKSFLALEKEGWIIEEAGFVDMPLSDKDSVGLPIISAVSGPEGPALWILSGIHGEEPAGPSALSESLDPLLELGRTRPVVIYPLCNPLGYAMNWRYFNRQAYSKEHPGLSVGDAHHLLLTSDLKPRQPYASSSPAADLTAHMIKTAQKRPPLYAYDLHEDALLSGGYVYSQTMNDISFQTAKIMIDLLDYSGVPIKRRGTTRFGELIISGIVMPVSDGSIDELLAAKKIMMDGAVVSGPGAEVMLTIETPAKGLALEKRVLAYRKVIEHLTKTHDIF
jgi:hypothetical protein